MRQRNPHILIKVAITLDFRSTTGVSKKHFWIFEPFLKVIHLALNGIHTLEIKCNIFQ